MATRCYKIHSTAVRKRALDSPAVGRGSICISDAQRKLGTGGLLIKRCRSRCERANHCLYSVNIFNQATTIRESQMLWLGLTSVADAAQGILDLLGRALSSLNEE